MSAADRVTAVSVTWNAADDVGEALRSAEACAAVIVVDNASEDSTVEVVRRAAPDAQLIVNATNAGFAAGANQGLGRVKTEFALLLNPDAVLASGAVEALVSFADHRPRAGLVSALVLDERQRPERTAGGRQPTLTSVAVHELGLSGLLPTRSVYGAAASQPRPMEWVAATALLVRMQAVAEVGGLDEGYFLYCEDQDWCRRLGAAGWESWIEPAAVAHHRRSSSVNRAGSWVDEFRVGSIDRYFAANHSRRQTTVFRLLRLAGISGRAFVFSVAAAVLRRPPLTGRAQQRRRDSAVALRLLRRH